MDGKQEVKFTGISAFAFAAIPWILAIGATAWLTFWWTGHTIREQLAQEQRMATYVGAEIRPKKPVEFQVSSKTCARITRAEYDGDRVIAYAVNECSHELHYLRWVWQLLAPDGTVLRQGYENNATCPTPSMKGDKAECALKLVGYGEQPEDRAAVIRLWLQDSPFDN